MLTDAHVSHAVGASRVTVVCLQSRQCHAGMRWPHQSCRETHQSRMLYIHSKYVFAQFAGTNVMRPSSTALIAGSASGFIFIHHCMETSGSTMVRQRWHLRAFNLYGSIFSSSPSFSNSATTCLRASKRSRPAKRPASRVVLAFSSITLMLGRL